MKILKSPEDNLASSQFEGTKGGPELEKRIEIGLGLVERYMEEELSGKRPSGHLTKTEGEKRVPLIDSQKLLQTEGGRFFLSLIGDYVEILEEFFGRASEIPEDFSGLSQEELNILLSRCEELIRKLERCPPSSLEEKILAEFLRNLIFAINLRIDLVKLVQKNE